MYLPNYEDGSIVNLMSSITEAFGKKAMYKPLKNLKADLSRKNTVLIVIDGLGYEWLKKYGKGSFLYDKL